MTLSHILHNKCRNEQAKNGSAGCRGYLHLFPLPSFAVNSRHGLCSIAYICNRHGVEAQARNRSRNSIITRSEKTISIPPFPYTSIILFPHPLSPLSKHSPVPCSLPMSLYTIVLYSRPIQYRHVTSMTNAFQVVFCF